MTGQPHPYRGPDVRLSTEQIKQHIAAMFTDRDDASPDRAAPDPGAPSAGGALAAPAD